MHAFQIIGRGDVTRGKAGSDEVSTTYRISATAADTGGCDEPVIYASSVSHCSVESNAVVWLFALKFESVWLAFFFYEHCLSAPTTAQKRLSALLCALAPRRSKPGQF